MFVLAAAAVAQEPSYKDKIAALASALKSKKATPDDVTEAIDAVADGYREALAAEKKLGVKSIGKASKSRNLDIRHGTIEAFARKARETLSVKEFARLLRSYPVYSMPALQVTW